MNIDTMKTYWYPVLKLSELKGGPRPVVLLGVRLVLVERRGEVACFIDKCPHRGVPLSKGRMVGENLQCCYHGWQFDMRGSFVKSPSCQSCDKYKINLQQFKCKVDGGIIWVCLSGERGLEKYFLEKNRFDSVYHFKILKSDFLHSIENFLDPLHTFFIHKGLFRGRGHQEMKINQSVTNDGFATEYEMVTRQNGLINKIFDNGIDLQKASFSMPGFAEIEYFKKNNLKFKVSIFFIPIISGEIKMLVKVSLKKTWVPSFLKFLVLRPFLEIAYWQDKKILEIQQYSKKNPGESYKIIETDLVMDHLLHLFNEGKEGEKKKFTLSL